MPEHYEAAAHMLLFLMAAGLTAKPDVDCRRIVAHIAERLERDVDRLRGLSHIAASEDILGGIERNGLASCAANKRTRVLKLLGTALANFLTANAA